MSRYEPDPNIPDPPADRQQPEQEAKMLAEKLAAAIPQHLMSILEEAIARANVAEKALAERERHCYHSESVALRARAEAAEVQAAALREALERIAKMRCALEHDGGCAESWRLAMGGKVPVEEQKRRYCQTCVARAALTEKEERRG